MLDFNFYHSGDLGDIIYSLPTIKALGGGKLYLGNIRTVPEGNPPDKFITTNVVNELKEVLNQQQYISNVEFVSTLPRIDYDLNKFRTFFIDWQNNKYTADEIERLKQINLVELTQRQFNITGNIYLHKWLTCQPFTPSYPIIVNRTFRYQNNDFPWKTIVEHFHDQMSFIGHRTEFDKFTNLYGKIHYTPTITFNDAFTTINSCKLFIGNQSFCYSLAEGLKKPCIQETDTWMNNCMYFRKDAYITNTTPKLNFKSIKQFIIRNLL